ncbi:hypothetical protein C6495_00895 [Candidatus Poribacteria bacterium]|nr:MAG: hypothetical protein C6495_00895 [Candidatus Poribacteria bacterium]
MHSSDYPREVVVSRGKAIYRQLRDKVEPAHKGKILAIDVKTGNYEIDDEDAVAMDRIRAKNPDAMVYCLRIGSPAVHRFGFRVSVPNVE